MAFSLRKTPTFHIISYCGNFVERLSFRRVLSKSLETLRILRFSTKFPHQQIRRNFGILRIVLCILYTLSCQQRQRRLEHWNKIPKFHLISRCADSPETQWKPCVFLKLHTREIMWNYDILLQRLSLFSALESAWNSPTKF